MLFFSIGGIGGIVSRMDWQQMKDVTAVAFTNQYHARTGHIEGDRTFYIRSTVPDLLINQLSTYPDVKKRERTILDNVVIVEIAGDVTATFNAIRKLDSVNAITAIPLFCH